MAKTKEVRCGRQTPTVSVVLPYEQTKGQEAIRQEAIKLYNSTTRKAQGYTNDQESAWKE